MRVRVTPGRMRLLGPDGTPIVDTNEKLLHQIGYLQGQVVIPRSVRSNLHLGIGQQDYVLGPAPTGATIVRGTWTLTSKEGAVHDAYYYGGEIGNGWYFYYAPPAPIGVPFNANNLSLLQLLRPSYTTGNHSFGYSGDIFHAIQFFILNGNVVMREYWMGKTNDGPSPFVGGGPAYMNYRHVALTIDYSLWLGTLT